MTRGPNLGHGAVGAGVGTGRPTVTHSYFPPAVAVRNEGMRHVSSLGTIVINHLVAEFIAREK